jgi:hypothetical protein
MGARIDAGHESAQPEVPPVKLVRSAPGVTAFCLALRFASIRRTTPAESNIT